MRDVRRRFYIKAILIHACAAPRECHPARYANGFALTSQALGGWGQFTLNSVGLGGAAFLGDGVNSNVLFSHCADEHKVFVAGATAAIELVNLGFKCRPVSGRWWCVEDPSFLI